MKSNIVLIFLWLAISMPCIAQEQKSVVILRLKNGNYLSLQACTDQIFRIRISAKPDFPPSLMERYGIIETNWKQVQVTSRKEKNSTIIQTGKFQIAVDTINGDISVQDLKGKTIIDRISYLNANTPVGMELRQSLNNYFGKEKSGGGIIGDKEFTTQQTGKTEVSNAEGQHMLSISLKDDERFYGGGSSSRKSIQHRGMALQVWASYQTSESAMPFLISSNGWGIFNNTTWKNYFDIGRFQNDKLFLYNTGSGIDFYLIPDKDMIGVLQSYTTITGKPYLLPKYGYGLAFGSNIMEDQFDVLNNASKFREENIPCDIYWLEPQWMKTNYDYTTKKDWNTDRFQASYYWMNDPLNPKATNLYIKRMKDLGFKTALWLCIDHDLTIEEEDYLSKKSGKPQSGMEHWFPHLNKFMDQGVVGFKLDPGRTLNEHPERKYYNGKTDAEMHNLNQVLLQKQMYTTSREHTGLRSFQHYCGGYAGSQHWGAATVGDNGGYITSLYDVINHSFSGNSNMSVDMLEDVAVKGPGIHYSFFTPWVQLNSWAWILHPWYYNQSDKEMFRFYAQLRYSLIPYIYSAALNSSLTGQPIVWPMALAYPGEAKFAGLFHQYMFGENLLVGAYTDSVYLPEGNWIDYWTNKKYAGNQLLKPKVPKDRGGPLFIKAGAIIPYQKPMQYIGEQTADTLIIKVYPEKQSSYTLLEDDGISFDYEKGAVAITKFTCNASSSNLEFIIHPTQGAYKKMPDHRVYDLEISWPSKPKQIQINGKVVTNWTYNSEKIFITGLSNNLIKEVSVKLYSR